MLGLVLFRRLALVAGALATVAALGGAMGACGGAFDSTPDGGAPPPDGSGADLGFGASDLGSASVTLQSPAPLVSLQPTMLSFQFLATVSGATPQALEPFVEVVPRPHGTVLSGAFNWKQTAGGAYRITFMPSGVADATDYTVTVTSPRDQSILLKTGISTGSRPRVIGAELHAESSGEIVYALLRFSEPMSPSSMSSCVHVSGNGKDAGGTLSVVSDGTQPANTAFRFDLPASPMLKPPVVLQIDAGAKAMTGVPLIAASWDSPTADSYGNFKISWSEPLDTQTSVTETFTPVVN
jgi:hypothetical protein